MIDCRFVMIRAMCVLSEVIVSFNDREYIPKRQHLTMRRQQL
jgi:hypothetical protein